MSEHKGSQNESKQCNNVVLIAMLNVECTPIEYNNFEGIKIYTNKISGINTGKVIVFEIVCVCVCVIIYKIDTPAYEERN